MMAVIDELSVESIDECNVDRLAGPSGVEGDATRASPETAADELAAPRSVTSHF
jgi:hypothetical protein